MVVRGGRTNLVSANYEKYLTPTYHHMNIRCLTTTSLTKMISRNMFNCSGLYFFFQMKMDSLSPFWMVPHLWGTCFCGVNHKSSVLPSATSGNGSKCGEKISHPSGKWQSLVPDFGLWLPLVARFHLYISALKLPAMTSHLREMSLYAIMCLHQKVLLWQCSNQSVLLVFFALWPHNLIALAE